MGLFKSNLTIGKLFYLITRADNVFDDKERKMGERMIEAENIERDKFYVIVDSLEGANLDELFNECTAMLRKFDVNTQIHHLAWLCVIANSDGFMDKSEWNVIYKLYKVQLGLDLDAIMNRQKEIVKGLLTNREYATAQYA